MAKFNGLQDIPLPIEMVSGPKLCTGTSGEQGDGEPIEGVPSDGEPMEGELRDGELGTIPGIQGFLREKMRERERMRESPGEGEDRMILLTVGDLLTLVS